VVRKCL